MKATRRILFVLACLVLTAGVQGLQAQTTPNVLFYLTDDLGYGDVGCYGAEGQSPVGSKNSAELKVPHFTRFTA